MRPIAGAGADRRLADRDHHAGRAPACGGTDALKREVQRIATRYGEVAVKIAYHHGQPLRGKPEYEDCKRLALDSGVPIHRIYEAARQALAERDLSLEPVEWLP